MFRKSQAALEFLTTYGWAFLVILIMIGALAYFGVLSPSKILPNRCTMGTEFQCLDHQLVVTVPAGGVAGDYPQMKLRLKNNVGEAITVLAADIAADKEDGTSLNCNALAADISGWKSGEIKDITLLNCDTATNYWISGEKGRAFTTVSYYTVASGSTYKKPVKGEILSTVI